MNSDNILYSTIILYIKLSFYKKYNLEFIKNKKHLNTTYIIKNIRGDIIMNKRAQEPIQQMPAIDHPSHKKLIIIAVIAVVIIALAVAAFVIFSKGKATPEAEQTSAEQLTEEQQAQETLDSLAQDLTPEEQAAAEETLNSLAEGITPEEQQNAQEVLDSL